MDRYDQLELLVHRWLAQIGLVAPGGSSEDVKVRAPRSTVPYFFSLKKNSADCKGIPAVWRFETSVFLVAFCLKHPKIAFSQPEKQSKVKICLVT